MGISDAGNGDYDYGGEYSTNIGGDYFEEGSEVWESDSEGWRLKDGRYNSFQS